MKNSCTFVRQIKMKRKIINILELPWKLIISTTATWDNIASSHASKKEIRNQYVFPWIAITVMVVFIFESVYASEKPLQTGLINAIISSVSLFGGYFLSNTICFWYLRKQQPEKYTALDCERIVSYSFSAVFLLKIVTTVLPSLFFLQILNIYTAYMVWEGCRAVLKMNEEERGNIVLIFTLFIIFSPVVISLIVHLMLPNV